MVKRSLSTLKFCYGHINRSIHSASHPRFNNGETFNVYVTSLCKQKLFRDALLTFDFIDKNADCALDPSAYPYLISACASVRSIEYGRKIHNHILKSNVLPHMILENHIINMYGKCGSTKDARKAFDDMEERNVVSWTSLIAGYAQNGYDIEAIKLYIQMQRSDFMPDHFTFGSVIKACWGMSLGMQFHAQVIKSEFRSHLIAQNALIAMYSKFGHINEACSVFSRIESKDLISWSSIIAGFSKLGYELESLSYFREMLSQSTYKPNEYIFGSIFRACGSLGQLEYGRQIHGLSIKYGFEGNVFAGCSLTDMYARCGFLYSAKRAFELIENPDIVSWNAVIAGFAYGGDANEAMSIFSRMRHSTSTPDDITVRSLLCGFTDQSTLSQGKQLHSYIIKIGLDVDVPVCNTLLTMYSKCFDHTDAHKIFINVQDSADLVSWNAIITMCVHQNQVAEVFSFFRMMLLYHGKPDHITLANILGVCGKVASLEIGDQVYCFSVKNGLDFDIMVMNGLIDMYVKCGSLERARKLFDCMTNPDVVSWSSLIVGYAQFGSGEKALDLFRRMKEHNIKPNQVTLVGVLTACSYVGLVDEGMQLFESMEREQGIVPTREHVSCVVDLLARAGRIHDAEAFINRMVVEPDIVMWKTLLAACKTRGNIEVGKRVAESILKMDPSNSAAHVLLCSIHASAGDWKDVASVRSLMRERGVKKVPGQSWIGVKDGVHVFSSKDGLHPERDKIYSMLKELGLHILDAEYSPPLLEVNCS